MNFEIIPKTKAKEILSYIESEEKFYSFVEEYNLTGVHWSQPTSLSASYFFRLLQEGASARVRGYSRGYNEKRDDLSDEMLEFYTPLLDHGALWRLRDGRVICTAMPYGNTDSIVDSFYQMVEKFGYPNTIKMDFLSDRYRFRPNGDHMIIIYHDDSEEEFDPDYPEAILREKAIQHSRVIPIRHQVYSSSYVRDRYVSEYAKRRAHGICQLCNQPAPFCDNSGEPYLETHHIIWLADGGDDSIENTIALCPNCHRKMHTLNHQEDIDYLLQIAQRLS